MFDLLPVTGYLRLPDVLRIYPVSKSTWWAGIKGGRFPQGHKLLRYAGINRRQRFVK